MDRYRKRGGVRGERRSLPGEEWRPRPQSLLPRHHPRDREEGGVCVTATPTCVGVAVT